MWLGAIEISSEKLEEERDLVRKGRFNQLHVVIPPQYGFKAGEPIKIIKVKDGTLVIKKMAVRQKR